MESRVGITGMMLTSTQHASRPVGVTQEWQLLLLPLLRWKGLRHLGWVLEPVLILMGRELGLGAKGEPGFECERAWSREQGSGCGLDCGVHKKQDCPWWASTKGVTVWTSQTWHGCEQSRERTEV